MKSEWNIASLRNLVGYISKGIVPSYADKESKTTIRVLNQRCNRNFRISYVESRLHDVAKKKVAAERYLKPNDILINSTGKGTAGRIAQIDYVPYDTTVDGHMIIIRANELVTQMYLAYALKSHQWEVLQLDEGSTGQTELNRERLLDEIMICYPTSKTEQERVVAVLEGIDEKIKNNIAINDNLYAQAKAKLSFFIQCRPLCDHKLQKMRYNKHKVNAKTLDMDCEFAVLIVQFYTIDERTNQLTR